MTKKNEPEQLLKVKKGQAGFIPVTIKMTTAGHRRLKQHAADYRGRKMGTLANVAVQYVLDLIEAGETPPAFTEAMNNAIGQVEGGEE